MEDAHGFYSELMDLLDDHLQNEHAQLEYRFQLSYFNTSSSKYFLDMIRAGERSPAGRNGAVRVLWMYEHEDLDMKEAGQDYKALSELKFEIKAI